MEHIVVSWNSCGHIDRDYIIVAEVLTCTQITNLVHMYYGKENGVEWRIATPKEREKHSFEYISYDK